MIDNSIEFYEGRLVDIEQKMTYCRQDIQDGIDYDYSQDLLDELYVRREDIRLELSSYKRRIGHSLR